MLTWEEIAEHDHGAVTNCSAKGRRHRISNGKDRPVLAREHFIVGAEGPTLGPDLVVFALCLRKDRCPVLALSVDDVVQAFALQVCLCPAKHLRYGTIHVRRPALAIGCDQALSHLVHGHRTELVRLTLLGDIDHHDAHPDDFGTQMDRVVARQQVVLASGLCRNLSGYCDVEDGLVVVQDMAVDPLDLRPNIGHDLSHRLAYLVLGPRPAYHRQCLVEVDHTELSVHEAEADGGTRLKGLQGAQRLGRPSFGFAQGPYVLDFLA